MIGTTRASPVGRLRDELAGQAEPDGRGRRQADGARLRGTAFQVALALEDLEVVVDGRRGGEADRTRDLAHRRRKATRAQRRRDEVEDLDLAFGVVLRHSRLLVLHHSERTFDVKVRRVARYAAAMSEIDGPTRLTDRLILRRWRDDDRAPFAAMNADPEVMRYFPSIMTRQESDQMIDAI